MKSDQKIKAVELRKQNKGYNEIAKTVGVSKSTISNWFHGIEWSELIKKNLTERQRKLSSKRIRKVVAMMRKRWSKFYENAETQAISEFPILKNNHLFIAGLMLYWGEGDKRFQNGQVRIGNSDPNILRIFKRFLQEICGVAQEKIRAYILIYPDLNSKACLNYWSSRILLPKQNFSKSVIIQGRHKTKRLNYGVCTVNVSNKFLKKKILNWINFLSKEL